MKNWRNDNKLRTYSEEHFSASFRCKAKFKTQIAFEAHVSLKSRDGCIYHYAINQTITGFRSQLNKLTTGNLNIYLYILYTLIKLTNMLYYHEFMFLL